MRVALVSGRPADSLASFWPSYPALRLQAELARAQPELEVRLFELPQSDDGTSSGRDLLDFAPDLVGCSAYVWSFPRLLAVAEQLKRARPDTTVVFGGPSARPAMFTLEPYRAAQDAVDALVIGEGERAFSRMARLGGRSQGSLAALPGVSVRRGSSWSETVVAPAEAPSELGSPYQFGLVPRGSFAPLETFRGCPHACAFCQWGAASTRPVSFSTAAIARDLAAIGERGFNDVFLVDAALNLSAPAFRNLAEAEQSERVLERIPLSFEVYPGALSAEHLRFLERIRLGNVGLGVQSWDQRVLDPLGRPQRSARVASVVHSLNALGAQVALELILGLPGDSFDGFFRTLERARELPCEVRVFHCLVLPDALMTRAPAGAEISFDPLTLRLRSCAGWSEDELARAVAELDASAHRLPDSPFSTWVVGKNPPVPAMLSTALAAEVAARVANTTGGRWQLVKSERRGGQLFAHLTLAGEALLVVVHAGAAQERAFVSAGEVGLSYRGSPSEQALAALRADAGSLAPALARLLDA